MRRIALESWTVRPIGAVGTVPPRLRGACVALASDGYAHGAFVAAGLLPDIDGIGGEAAQEWIGRTDWCFSTWVRLGEADLRHRHVELAFDWIDTLGDVLVNGVCVACVGNEFVPLRQSVRAFFVAGVNEIEVRLRGPVAAVEALERRCGPRPVNGDWTPFPFLRKCASNFGWDWGPRAASAGMGGGRVECFDGPRIAEVRPLVVACDADEATLDVHVRCDHASGGVPVRVELVRPEGGEIVAQGWTDDDGRAVASLQVERPARWWPRGMGAQALHRVSVAVEGACEPWTARVGLRRVELDTAADAHGRRFLVRVNGRDVWCRGANWVPRSPCPRARPAALESLERLAADANCTMLRVWGGGIYEHESFYDRCDELGILVWQDFMFACATYPEEPPYSELVEREARVQVARLSSHACVVLWCGGNEDILAWWSWGWKERLAPHQTWGRGYWLELLPRVMREVDPTRPYWPESPYSGSMDLHPNDPDHGDRHTWDAKLEGYRSIVPRFCSEFGHQSPPTRATLREVLRDRDRVIGNDELASRQRAWGGDRFQYAPFLEARSRPPRTLDEWVFACQLLQARAYEVAITWHRANAPRCMGALYWQLNDVWSGHSWSVIDSRGRRKPAYFAARRACAARALTILPCSTPPLADPAQMPEEPHRVVLCTAAGEATGTAPSEVRVRLVDASGATIVDESLALIADSAWTSSAALPERCKRPAAPDAMLLVADCGGCRATHAYVHDSTFRFVPAAMRRRVAAGAVEIEASTLVRDACLDERLEPLDGMLTLLPGEVVRVVLGSAQVPQACDVEIITAADVGAA